MATEICGGESTRGIAVVKEEEVIIGPREGERCRRVVVVVEEEVVGGGDAAVCKNASLFALSRAANENFCGGGVSGGVTVSLIVSGDVVVEGVIGIIAKLLPLPLPPPPPREEVDEEEAEDDVVVTCGD